MSLRKYTRAGAVGAGVEVIVVASALLLSGCGERAGGSASTPERAGGAGESFGSAGSASELPADYLALTPQDGWVDAANDSVRVRGALYLEGDPASLAKSVGDFSGDHACMSGESVELPADCVPEPPFRDCAEMFRGSEIRLNFNQEPGGEPLPLDASAIAGFGFDFAGSNQQLRVIATSADGTEFCTASVHTPSVGHNTLLLSELVALCYQGPFNPTAEASRESLVSLAWRIVPRARGVVPFDFCISNLRALLE